MVNRTFLDIELAKVYFEILVDFAKSQPGKTIQYGQLVATANERYPENSFVKSAIATSMGRRLDALRDFTNQKKLPDLTSLVVNKITGDNGEGFKKSFDGEAVRRQVSDFDWSEVKVDFDTYLVGERLAVEERERKSHKPKKIKEPDARTMWWDFCKENPNLVDSVTYDVKEKVILLIMGGQTPNEAMHSVKSTGV
jgi:hypothetical protein